MRLGQVHAAQLLQAFRRGRAAQCEPRMAVGSGHGPDTLTRHGRFQVQNAAPLIPRGLSRRGQDQQLTIAEATHQGAVLGLFRGVIARRHGPATFLKPAQRARTLEPGARQGTQVDEPERRIGPIRECRGCRRVADTDETCARGDQPRIHEAATIELFGGDRHDWLLVQRAMHSRYRFWRSFSGS
jgi:hypothetical protein